MNDPRWPYGFLAPAELRTKLGVSDAELDELVAAHRIPSVNVGGRTWFSLDSFAALRRALKETRSAQGSVGVAQDAR